MLPVYESISIRKQLHGYHNIISNTFLPKMDAIQQLQSIALNSESNHILLEEFLCEQYHAHRPALKMRIDRVLGVVQSSSPASTDYGFVFVEVGKKSRKRRGQQGKSLQAFATFWQAMSLTL